MFLRSYSPPLLLPSLLIYISPLPPCRSLSIYTLVLGSESPEAAVTTNNLAVVLCHLGETEEGRELLERTGTELYVRTVRPTVQYTYQIKITVDFNNALARSLSILSVVLKLLMALPCLPNRLLSILVTYLKNDSKKLEGLLYAGLTYQHTKGTAI